MISQVVLVVSGVACQVVLAAAQVGVGHESSDLLSADPLSAISWYSLYRKLVYKTKSNTNLIYKYFSADWG